MRRAVNQLLPRSKNSRLVPRKLKSLSLVGDFYISLNDPHKVYRPGDEVVGQIILLLSENSCNLKLNLSLEGSIKVCSNSPLRSDKKEQLFNHSIQLYGDANNNERGLSSGEHRFPFIVKIPKKYAYTSIKFEKGEIKYVLRTALVTTQDEILSISEKLLNIIKPINLELLPEAHPKVLNFRNISSKKSLRATLSSTSSLNSSASVDSSGSSTNDNVRIKLTLPYLGYLKGESIPVKLNVKHYKPISNVRGIIVTLIRVCKLDLGRDYEFESYRKDITQSIIPLILDMKTFKCEISTSLKIPPDCFPTIVSPSLSFQYFIEVLVNLSSNSKISANTYNLPNKSVSSLSSRSIQNDDILYENSTKPMVNVDNMKKMKNILTITNEIVIGTERRPLSKLRSRSGSERSPVNTDSASSEMQVIGEVGSLGGLQNDAQTINDKLPPLLELPSQLNPLTGYGLSSSVRDTSLPLDNNTSTVRDNSITALSNSNFAPLAPIDIPPSLDEKEILRQREQAVTSALLPSQPPPSSSIPTNDITLPPNINIDIQPPSLIYDDMIQYAPVPKYSKLADKDEYCVLNND